MDVAHLNRRLLELPQSHAARRFLEAFMRCRLDCVGKEISWDGGPEIDQEWYSVTDARTWRFSNLMYGFVSFAIILDGWLDDAPKVTPLELAHDQKFQHLRRLLAECEVAAKGDGNKAVLIMIEQVYGMLDLWDAQLLARGKRIADHSA
jgi:hypothetical protein